MSDDYVDVLARKLAGPTTRRRAFGIFTVGAIALATPLRPRVALAQEEGRVLCSAANEFCREVSCPEGTTCCSNSNPPGNCPDNPHCCDPCYSTCGPTGACLPKAADSGCTDECCAKYGQGPCCGQLCCASDQVCDSSRQVCCPPESDPPKCNRPESTCEKKADEIVKAQKDSVGGSDHAPGGLEAATAFAILDIYSRYREYDKCPQVPDDKECASGGRCDPATLVCRQCAGTRRRSESSAGLRVQRRSGRSQGLPAQSGRRASKGSLAASLRDRYQARDKALGQLLSVCRADREGPGPYRDLAKALQTYRGEIVRLGKSFKKGNGGAQGELVLEMCGELADGLGGLREAALSTDRVKAQALARSGEKSMGQGIKLARKLPRAFGCGKRCL